MDLTHVQHGIESLRKLEKTIESILTGNKLAWDVYSPGSEGSAVAD